MKPRFTSMIRKPSNSQKNGTTACPRGRRSFAHQNRPAEKVIALIFLYKDGILLGDYQLQGFSITGQYYACWTSSKRESRINVEENWPMGSFYCMTMHLHIRPRLWLSNWRPLSSKWSIILPTLQTSPSDYYLFPN